jgi:hypothetical protein
MPKVNEKHFMGELMLDNGDSLAFTCRTSGDRVVIEVEGPERSIGKVELAAVADPPRHEEVAS